MPTVETWQSGWRRVRRTNTTDASFPTMVDVVGRGNLVPDKGASVNQNTARSIIGLRADGTNGIVRNGAIFKPYAVGADNTAFTMRINLWSFLCEEGDEKTGQWTWIELCELTITLGSTFVGVVDGLLPAAARYADTVSLVGTSGNKGTSIEIYEGANNTPAWFKVDLAGAQMLEPGFKIGTCTSVNSLVRLLD